MIEQLIPQNWMTLLKTEINKNYFKTLSEQVTIAYKHTTVYPQHTMLFRALDICSPENTKVVIIGQDPYHEPHQADGLAFSVPYTTKIPGSLNHIIQEIELENSICKLENENLFIETNKQTPSDSYLLHWAQQGVLLLNATMTVEKGKPGSHSNFGWQIFTNHIIETLSQEFDHIAFMLWGNNAIQKQNLIDTTRHLILTSKHPSGLSWGKSNILNKPQGKIIKVTPEGNRIVTDRLFEFNGYGRKSDDSFWGSMQFVAANNYLTSKGKKAINFTVCPRQ